MDEWIGCAIFIAVVIAAVFVLAAIEVRERFVRPNSDEENPVVQADEPCNKTLWEKFVGIFKKNQVWPAGPVAESCEDDLYQGRVHCCLWFGPMVTVAFVVVIVLALTGVLK